MGPSADRILVKPIKAQSTSSIYVATSKREKPHMGEIEEVGPDVVKAKPGDKIIFGPNAGADVVIQGENKIIMREFEIYYFL